MKYAFNDSYKCVFSHLCIVMLITLEIEITYVREKSGRFKGELLRAQFFRNSCRTRQVFKAKMNTTVRTEVYQEGICVNYVVIYTNDEIV